MTSVDALIGEVTALLGYSNALKAGQHAFFGENLGCGHPSNLEPSTSSQGEKQVKPQVKARKEPAGARKEPTGALEKAIAGAKETLKQALGDDIKTTKAAVSQGEIAELRKDIKMLKEENIKLKATLAELQELVAKHLKIGHEKLPEKKAEAVREAAKPKAPEGDGDFDLFGSSDEEVDEEKERIKQERLRAYAERKAKKPASIAKSSVILDVKPWDDETVMEEMETNVREIEQDGLVWGGSKFIPLAYGLKKLQIICVIEDEKVSVEDLIDRITEGISEQVQSVDIVAFNKL